MFWPCSHADMFTIVQSATAIYGFWSKYFLCIFIFQTSGFFFIVLVIIKENTDQNPLIIIMYNHAMLLVLLS